MFRTQLMTSLSVLALSLAPATGALAEDADEIGRASCRERV